MIVFQIIGLVVVVSVVFSLGVGMFLAAAAALNEPPGSSRHFPVDREFVGEWDQAAYEDAVAEIAERN